MCCDESRQRLEFAACLFCCELCFPVCWGPLPGAWESPVPPCGACRCCCCRLPPQALAKHALDAQAAKTYRAYSTATIFSCRAPTPPHPTPMDPVRMHLLDPFLVPSQSYQVVTDFGSQALQRGVALMIGALDIVPIHISLYDASGDGGLVEFDGQKVREAAGRGTEEARSRARADGTVGQRQAEGRMAREEFGSLCPANLLLSTPGRGPCLPQGWTLYRNVSAATNMPTYPEQLANLRRWREAAANTR